MKPRKLNVLPLVPLVFLLILLKLIILVLSGCSVSPNLPNLLDKTFITFSASLLTANPITASSANLIMKDSPAYRAGIRKGDTVVEVNDTSIQSLSDFNRVLTNLRIEQGNRVVVKVKRSGELLDLELEYPYIPGSLPQEIEVDKEMISPSP